MKLYRDLHQLGQPCVATIGNFDGVHLGHQAIFEQLKAVAVERGLPVLLVTFDPQPREFFQADCPARLTRLREKCFYFKRFGIEQVVCLRFNHVLAKLPANAFVQDILCKKLNIQHLVVGDDFRFGHRRQGDYPLLQALGEQWGFTVSEAVTVQAAGGRISSSRVRAALQAGDLGQAESLLGHPYVIQARVTHGKKIGRTLNFPTLNLPLHRKKSPLQGVFAVKVHGLGREYYGAANLGTRPAVGGGKTLLEVHLFDFDQTVYGELVTVEFCHKLRDEQNFADLAALKQAIAKDVAQIKQFFQIDR